MSLHKIALQAALLFTCFGAAIIGSYSIGYDHGQARGVNDLLSVGFTVTDPEGYKIAQFAE